MYALEVKDLSCLFPDGAGISGISGISDLSFAVKRGEIYTLLGSHGSGKSVLLQNLLGALLPKSGSIKLFGSGAAAERFRLGYLPQGPCTIARLPAVETLRYFSLAAGVLDARFDPVLGIHEKDNRPVAKRPLYEQRLIGLGIALLGKPDLLFLDEPFDGLDAQEQEKLAALLVVLNRDRGITMLLTSRRLEAVAGISSRYGVLVRGRLVEELTPGELAERCERCVKIRTPQMEKMLPLLQKDYPQYEVLDDEVVRVFCPAAASGKLNAQLVTAGVEIREIWVAGVAPQDYLAKLMGGEPLASGFAK